MVQSGQPKPARRLGRSRRVGVPPRTHAFCPQVIKTKSSRKNCCCCGNSFFFWTNGTASNRGEGRGQHNVMETADFAGKPFPCPVCNVSLRLKISSKQKPYCMCLECGIQIFFRGQAGIQRLWKMIRSEEAVAAEFNVLYARVTSKEQEREGFSIPAQLKLLREYASRNEFQLVMEFVDIETAKSPGRQNFVEMARFFAGNKERDCRVILVEKTDRLYRNFRDAVTLEDLDLEIHLVKEGQIISKDAKSQAKLIHGMQLVLARNYIENLREEVKKGMREKAEQGIYPGRAPFGYRNNRTDRTIEIHLANAEIVTHIFELYSSGEYS